MNRRFVQRLARAACAALVLATAGCAEFAELISPDTDGRKDDAIAQAEAARLWEMTIMAGRYGVMLGQAREILSLPEPARGESFPTDDTDHAKQRAALAAYQATVANEFAADVGRACARKRVPKKVRALACAQRAKMPAELRQPVAPEIQALALRNDNVGDFVMTWWDAVCATAAKPKHPDDMPACPME